MNELSVDELFQIIGQQQVELLVLRRRIARLEALLKQQAEEQRDPPADE